MSATLLFLIATEESVDKLLIYLIFS